MADLITAEQDFINRRRSYLEAKKFVDENTAAEKKIADESEEKRKAEKEDKHAILSKKEQSALKMAEKMAEALALKNVEDHARSGYVLVGKEEIPYTVRVKKPAGITIAQQMFVPVENLDGDEIDLKNEIASGSGVGKIGQAFVNTDVIIPSIIPSAHMETNAATAVVSKNTEVRISNNAATAVLSNLKNKPKKAVEKSNSEVAVVVEPVVKSSALARSERLLHRNLR